MLLCRRLSVARQRIHGRGWLSRGHRDVLRELDRWGPRTVPELARAKSASRQHVQSLVNPLAERGYVEFVANPAHKRSHRVRLTSVGREFVEAMALSEGELLAKLDIGVGDADVRRAARCLRAVRQALERE